MFRLLTRDRSWWVTLASVGVLLQLVLFLASPLEVQLGFVPDDTFYYLKLARSFAESGQWSFDGGLTRTTGFHLLHAYFCSLVQAMAPQAAIRGVLSTVVIVEAALTVAALVLFDGAMSRAFRSEGRLAILLVGAAGGFVVAPLMGMEWAWVTFFSALLTWTVIQERLALALLASTLGTLSRTDFALIPCALLVGALAVWRWRKDRRFVATGAGAAAGGILGFVLVTAHNLLVSGSWIQSSAAVKAHWGAVSGYNVLPAIDAAAKITSPGFLLLRTLNWGPLVFVAFALVVGLLAAKIPTSTGQPPEMVDEGAVGTRLLLGIASPICALGYVAIYGLNSAATQIWYSSVFVLPMVVAWSAVAERCRDTWPRGAAIAAGVLLAIVTGVDARRPEWGGRSLAKDAAARIDDRLHGVRIGSWNAGVFAYFSQNHVINIDGIVNDELYPFIISGTLHCYLLKKDIGYVFDGEDMLNSPYPERGGYADGTLRRALLPVSYFGDRPPRLVLFQVDRDLLAREGHCPSASAVLGAPPEKMHSNP